jgi:hypothetical protein
MSKSKKASVRRQISFTLRFEGEPVAYCRERFTRFGGAGHGRFYNPRASQIDALNKRALEGIKKIGHGVPGFLSGLIGQGIEGDYDLTIRGRFYLPIPKSAPEWRKEAMRQGSIRPATKPDADNLIKLVLDAMHGALYDDDKRVVSVSSEKFYSDDPRTEIDVEVREYDIVQCEEDAKHGKKGK